MNASHSAGVTTGPGSLSWVVSPVDSSTTATVRRVAPPTGTSASVTEVSWASSERSASPVPPPAKPVATARWPSAVSTRATFRPLPPGRSETSVTRFVECGWSRGTR